MARERVWMSGVGDEEAWILTGPNTWMCLECGHEGEGLEPHECKPDDEPRDRGVMH